MTETVPASYKADAFDCVFCQAYAHQIWSKVAHNTPGHSAHAPAQAAIDVCACGKCGKFSVWVNQRLVVPQMGTAPMPHSDMPNDVVADFEEARSVLSKSPRSSAALLRLALQKLCGVLGESGKNINNDVASLVAKGLPVQVQQSLDIIRVVGNEQVHPGELDVRDDPSIATELFALINFIVEDRITRPKTIGDLYARLPKAKRDGIERRDGAALASASVPDVPPASVS